MMARRGTVRPWWVAALAPGALATACSDDHNVMRPDGPHGSSIADLGWFMIITAGVIAVVFVGLLLRALWRGGRRARPANDRSERAFILAGGVALPLAVVGTLTVLSLNVLNDHAPAGALHITVTGHQYWWEVRYDDAGFTTANEFVIPVGRPVQFTLRSDDVIHSFWVPDLGGKIDMVPGHTNKVVLQASTPGRYRGQCAEYCGLQHAKMAVIVEAMAPADYDAWQQHESGPAVAATTAEARAGQEAFGALPCASCHTIRGTAARGDVGPDLTHFAARQTLGAGAAPNDRGHLGGWIANAQTTKPGNAMPPIPMSPEQLQAVLGYLESLR
jgi:cytochrome c oxidase subunit 2